jgi:ferredoxin
MQLERIASVMKDTSLCGLGQTAPNPFLSAMKNFREEFEEHIFDRKCRANICTGCDICYDICKFSAITVK